jgi:TP901 family phage tail tape measure protein
MTTPLRPTADFSSLIREAKKAMLAALKLDKSFVKLMQTTVRFAQTAKGATKAVVDLTAVTNDGQKMEARYGKSLKATALAIKSVSIAEQERAAKKAAADKAAEKQRRLEKSATSIAVWKRRKFDIPSTASAADVLMYNAQIKQLRDLIVKHKFTKAQVNKIWGELSTGNIVQYYNKQALLQKQIGTIIATQKKLGTVAAETAKETQRVLISFQSLVRLAAIQVLHRFFATLFSTIRDTVNEATKLQIKIAEIQTVDAAKVPFESWRKSIVELSNAFGTDILDQTEAAYQALSNQVATGANAFKFLYEANELATIGVSSTTSAVELLSSALNSYQMGLSRTRETAAKLFKAVELGRFRIEDIADDLGDITVFSAQLNVTLEETLAVLTSVTKQGMTHNKVMTQMRGVLMALIKPTEAMKEVFAELGVESGEALVKTYGFENLFTILKDVTEGSSTELAKLIPRIKGLGGALSLTGNAAHLFEEDLEKLKNALVDYDERLAIIMNNEGKRVEIFKTKIKNAFLEIGNETVLLLAKIADGLTKDPIGDHFKAIKKNLTDQEADFTKHISVLKKHADDLERIELQRLAATRQTLSAYEKSNVTAFETIYDELKERLDDYLQYLKSKRGEFDSLSKNMRKDVFDLVSGAKQKIFTEDLEKLDPKKQLRLIEKRLKEAKLAYRRSALLGSPEEFKYAEEQVRFYFDLRVNLLKNETSLNKRNIDLRKEYIKSIQEEVRNRQILEVSIFRSQTALRNTQITYEVLLKKLRDFSIESVMRLDDSVDRIKVFEEQKKNIEDLIKLQRKNNILGVEENELKSKSLYFDKQINAERVRQSLLKADKTIKDQDLERQKLENELSELQNKRGELLKIQEQFSKMPYKLMGALTYAGISDFKALSTQDVFKSVDALVAARTTIDRLLSDTKLDNVLKFNLEQMKQLLEGLPIDEEVTRLRSELAKIVDTQERNTLELQQQVDRYSALLDSSQAHLNKEQTKLLTLSAQNKVLQEQYALLSTLSTAQNLSRMFSLSTARVPKATGGRGTDTIPALLSPGEFVVNRKSASKFYSQLLAINDPRTQRFASGGVVNNYGGFNIPITVEAKNGNIDPREIGKQLNQMVRRGTFNYRGH